MDEEDSDFGPQSPELKTSVIKRTKVLIPSKDKTDEFIESTDPSKDKKTRKATASADPPKDKKTNKATASADPPKNKKTNKATASADPPKDKKTNKATASADPPKEKKTNKAAESAEPSKKSVLDLVCEAIEISGEKKKGASVQSIKKYVKSNYKSEAPNVNYLINRAIKKGFEKGTLERPPKSNAKGATGYFCLAKPEVPKRSTKIAKKQTVEEYVSDSEVIEKPVKHRKRNLSDTYIEEIRARVTSTPKPRGKQIATSTAAKKAKEDPVKKTEKDQGATELVLKKNQPKSKKLYSADTKVNLEHKKKITKASKETLKKAKPDKLKTEKTKPASKTKIKKVDNSTEEKENKTFTKT